MFGFKRLSILFTLLLILTFTAAAYAQYIPGNKDTKMPPSTMEISSPSLEGYTHLKTTTNFKYYFKETRDILAIYDQRSGYLWKTGIDQPFPNDVYAACDAAKTEEERQEVCVDVPHRLNAKFIGMANSLLTIEYYANVSQVDFISSAAQSNASSSLEAVADDNSHYVLNVVFERPSIELKLHIYLTERGLTYRIKHEEVGGDDVEMLAAIIITPFLGAEGGQYLKYNPEIGDYDFDPIRNELLPGYVLVPDGPGALIRFKDYDTALSAYKGSVYGRDQSLNSTYYLDERGFVPYKEPALPVFGIAHGNQQAAFLAYATTGDEQLEIIVSPDEDRNMSYTMAYPRFWFNRVYYQVYNRAGAGYNKLLDEGQKPNFDLEIHYEFLAGDGTADGKPADYVGMARAYREHLLREGILQKKPTDKSDIPIRVDFIMSDAQRRVLGFEDVVVTSIRDVQDILSDLHQKGVKNVNSGLLGYQKGGASLARPDKLRFSRSIGSRREFQDVYDELRDLDIDISFSQDFITFNENQLNLRGNALRHATTWYTRTQLHNADSPIDTYYYARTEKALNWLKNHLQNIRSLEPQSITIDGLQNILFSDYSDGFLSRGRSVELISEALSKIDSSLLINAANPNQYTWAYLDRYLQAPVFSSQFLLETDMVPFLQLVLQGMMEIYAPYANFSFYGDADVLRMIDYNVFPSFILTEQPAHLLMNTNSSRFYSTQYELYEDTILSIYNRVNGALREVSDSYWLDRKVLANGIILNSYSNGTQILLNYTDQVFVYNDVDVPPLDYKVFRNSGRDAQ